MDPSRKKDDKPMITMMILCFNDLPQSQAMKIELRKASKIFCFDVEMQDAKTFRLMFLEQTKKRTKIDSPKSIED